MQASKQASKQAGRQAGRQASRQAGKQASRQAGKQASKQESKEESKKASIPLASLSLACINNFCAAQGAWQWKRRPAGASAAAGRATCGKPNRSWDLPVEALRVQSCTPTRTEMNGTLQWPQLCRWATSNRMQCHKLQTHHLSRSRSAAKVQVMLVLSCRARNFTASICGPEQSLARDF